MRQQAEMDAKKEVEKKKTPSTGGGWFGGWFSGSKDKNKSIPEEDKSVGKSVIR